MTSNLNATYLFELPARSYRSSESWWTALFSIFLLHLARDQVERTIPIKRYRTTAGSWEYLPSSEPQFSELGCRGLTLGSVLTEARLTEALFGPGWPQQFLDLRPDLTIYRPAERTVIIIENKTIGASVGAQLDTYLAAVEYLRQQGWNAHAALLISIGYELTREWKAIERNAMPLVLWENVLRMMDEIEVFRHLFGFDLRPYYDVPERGSL